MIFAFQRQHSCHHARIKIGFRRILAFVKDRIESFQTPSGSTLRIDKQPRWIGGKQTHSIIHLGLICPTGDARVTTHLHLAGRIETTMADRTAAVGDGFHIMPIFHWRLGDGGLAEERVETGRVSRAKALVQPVAVIQGATGD